MSIIDLFRPRWQHSDWKVRMESVEKLTDQKKLSKIALTDKESRVRESAVSRVSDQKVLVSVAVKDPASEVALAALQRIENEKELVRHVDILMNLKRKKEVIRYIHNPQNLAGILARNSGYKPEDRDFRREILNRINDTKVLYDLLVSPAYRFSHSSPGNRVSGSEPATLIKEICETKPDPVLFDIVMHSRPLDYLPVHVVQSIRDPNLLVQIISSTLELKYRMAAIESIRDVKILGEIAVNPKDEKHHINIDLSKKAVQVLAGTGSPEAVSMLIEVLKANAGNECKLEAIIALQNMKGRPELPSSVVTETLMLFREWLKNTDQFVLEGDVDDAHGEYYAENKLFTRLKHAIAGLEKMTSESD
jgi:hypothetical protein